MIKKMCALLFSVMFMPSLNSVLAADSIGEVLNEGRAYIDARYRFEYVDQNGKPKEAKASTLRTRLGYKSGEFRGFMGVLEFEDVSQIGHDDYNDTLNGKTSYPVVADVESTEVNQAYLRYGGLSETKAKLGRQVIALDGHRFIGHVGWRQNNQTFDAFSLTNKSIVDTVLRYGYINRINRIFGDDSPVGSWDSDSHYFNASNATTLLGEIVAYGYLLDFRSDAPGVSSQTYGASLTGKQKINDVFAGWYHAEYAYQEDYGSNTTNYDADYYHLAGALIWKKLKTTIGYEVLGSDGGTIGFSTPLATLHKWNGWADVFLATPVTGLEDFYVDLTYKVSGMAGNLEIINGLLLKAQYHDFSAEKGSADYGTEWGFYAKQPITKHVYAELKYADYNTDGFATDRKKIIFGLGFKY